MNELPTSLRLTSSTEERAFTLLSQGISQESVAGALGVTPSYISQLISREDFAAALQEAKFAVLQRHNERDDKLDKLEDRLIEKLENNIPLMMRPMEIVRSLQVVNAAKRRGVSAPASVTQQQTVVQLVLPTQIINQFKANAQNMVINAGDQALLTMQSSTLMSKFKELHNDETGRTAVEAFQTGRPREEASASC